MRESKANHDGDGSRSRSFDARELVSRNHGYLFGGMTADYDDRRLSVSSCSKIPGKLFRTWKFRTNTAFLTTKTWIIRDCHNKFISNSDVVDRLKC